MIIPARLDIWFAEAVERVYAPWLTSAVISQGQKREVAGLIDAARRAAGMPPLGLGTAVRQDVGRGPSGRMVPRPRHHGVR